MSQITSFGAGSSSMGTVISLTGNAGGAVNPDGAGNIDILGSGGITVTGNPGAYNLVISTSGMATEYDTDSGNAVPAGGVLNLLGSHGINTSGAGNTVTTAINNAITLGDLSDITGSAALTVTTGNIELLSDTASVATSPIISFTHSNRIAFLYNDIYIGSSAGNLTASHIAGSGIFNVGIGPLAVRSITTGSRNVGVGNGVLEVCTTGQGNCAYGMTALDTLTTGNNNTAIGREALSVTGVPGGLVSGSRNIAIGAYAGNAYTSSESSNILLNNGGVVTENNTIRIGTHGGGAGQQNRTFMAGVRGVTPPASPAQTMIIDSAYQVGSSSAITYNTGGELNYPNQPAFLAVKDVAQNNATGNSAAVTVSYSNEIFDQNNVYDGTDTFTAPVTGRYYFSANVGYTSVVGTSGYINIVSSNRTFQGFLVNPTAIDNASNSLVLNFSTLIDMDASDTCTIETSFSGGAGNTVDLPALTTIMFSGYLVC